MKKLPALPGSLSRGAKLHLKRRNRRPLGVATARHEQRWSNLRKDFYLLLLIVVIAVPLIVVHQVLAADVLIDDFPSGTAVDHNGGSPTVVFTSDSVGYAFYVGVTGNCLYSKTTNGGTSWGTPVIADAQTDCIKIAVWYDQWTPGDTTGVNIHILTADSGSDDLFYRRLDTTTDTFTPIGGPVNASGAGQTGSFLASENIPSITKATNGVLYMGIQDDTDSFVIKCLSTCEIAANWSEAGTSPFDPDIDWLILMPLSGGDIIAIRWDISADVIDSKVFHAGTGLWDLAWTTLDGTAQNNVTYDGHFGATVNKTTNTIYLAYAADVGTIGTDDDIRTASYNGVAWIAKTNVLTNDAKGITGTKIATKQNTETIFVIYTARTTIGTANTGNVYYKRSTDGMITWGSEQGPLNTTAGDLYGARVNIDSDERIYVTWDDDTLANFLGSTVADLTTTAVEMADFTARASNKGVLLEWRSGYEVDNLGFNLYREQNGKRTLVNPSIIAGSALLVRPRTAMTAGDSYSWLDPQGSSDSVYYLEDIDLDGTRSLQGSVVPSRGPASSRSKLNRAMLLSELNDNAGKQAEPHSSQRGWAVSGSAAESYETPGDFTRSAAPGKEGSSISEDTSPADDRSLSVAGTSRSKVGAELLAIATGKRSAIPSGKSVQSTKRQRLLAGMQGLKLSVREDGWYRATQAELTVAGFDPNADMRSLQLYTDGEVVPIKINSSKGSGPLEAGDSIEFYGVGLDTLSTDTRQYWLVSSAVPGQRINAQTLGSSGTNGSSQSFDYTVQRKERFIYFSGLLNGDTENFFGAVVGTAPITQTLSVTHLAGISAPSLLEVALQGMTTANHLVKVQVNGTEVGLINFAGMEHKVAHLSLGSGLLHEGDNSVTLERTNGDSDISMVDYLRVTYAHTYQADNDYLQFTVNGSAVISGFSNAAIKLLDITNPNSVSLYTPHSESAADGYRFTVTTSQARTFLAITDQKARPLAAITRNQPSNWWMSTNRADFIIITHRNFVSSVEPLALLRRSQGLSVAVVDVDDIYDEFSFGAHSPQAIRSFLDWARGYWSQTPQYVLFVGDGSYDPRNYLSNPETDFVPARLIDTASLETASDDWFVDFDNDGVPEMAIGRLPVRTVAEAKTMISKTVNYSPDNTLQNALMVADSLDAKTQFSFESATDELSALLPVSIGAEKIFRANNAASAVHDQIITGINQGPLLVNFMGHGSVEIWTGAPILSTLDVPAFTNGQRLPVFLMMTCLNGYYQNPARESLAEALLRTDKGGAVAVWASSGMTDPQSQLEMSKALYQQLFGSQPLTLGEAIRKAKGANANLDVPRTWALLGDPTLQLRSTPSQPSAPDR